MPGALRSLDETVDQRRHVVVPALVELDVGLARRHARHDHGKPVARESLVDGVAQLIDRRHGRGIVAEGTRDHLEVLGARGGKESFERLGLEKARLGQEGEDPAAAVVNDDERARPARVTKTLDEGRQVVEHGQITDESDAGRACGHAERRRHDAVDAVDAPVGVGGAATRRRPPFDVAHRHR